MHTGLLIIVNILNDYQKSIDFKDKGMSPLLFSFQLMAFYKFNPRFKCGSFYLLKNNTSLTVFE